MNLNYSYGPVVLYSRQSVCPAREHHCLLLVMSLDPLPRRASESVGVGKTWRSAELYMTKSKQHTKLSPSAGSISATLVGWTLTLKRS